MALVLTQEGGLRLWQSLLGIVPIGAPNLHLLGTPFIPLHTSVYADFAANELSVSGYGFQTVPNSPGQWAFGPIPAGQAAQHLAIAFNITALCTIYGYWLADSSNAFALWGEQFAAPWAYDPSIPPFYLTLVPNLTSQP